MKRQENFGRIKDARPTAAHALLKTLRWQDKVWAMPTAETTAEYKLFCSGDDLFQEMLDAIDAAQSSVCLEMYIFSERGVGRRFLDALLRARERNVRVRVLVDAIGSFELAGNFWEPLVKAGGEAKKFNPLALKRVWIRNHRKLLVCDELVAFAGGFNIAPEYEGDGITRGWRDIAVRIQGPLAAQLVVSFDEMFERADFRHKHFPRLWKSAAKKTVSRTDAQIFFSGPGRGQNPIKKALCADLATARDVKIIVGYFLPTRRLRRELARVVRRGGRVQLILAGKTDVPLSQLAARSLYRRLLKRGVEIFEYEPQVLHAKMIIVDDAVYVGSANLDQRSLQINYELMARLRNREVFQQAQEVFDANLKQKAGALPGRYGCGSSNGWPAGFWCDLIRGWPGGNGAHCRIEWISAKAQPGTVASESRHLSIPGDDKSGADCCRCG
jgi:cardiolipin synthase